ncbi:hypothetical protein IWW57_000065 [Coemansia sp. S610]|nr:hypothetical protein IWW57_000065 [Coemansia sp. S610]
MLTPPLSTILYGYTLDPGILGLVFDMAPSAAVRGISYMTFGQPIPLMLSSLGRHAVLQVLALSHLRLLVWDALTLINPLPLLSDLHAFAPTLDQISESMLSDDLVGYVDANYSPMMTQF